MSLGMTVGQVGHYMIENPRPHQPPKVVTAAAQVMMGRSITKIPKRVSKQRWQSESWELRGEIGEYRFSGDRIARGVSLLRPYVGKVGKLGDAPTEVTEGLAYDLGADLFGNAASNQQNLFRAAQHVVYNGESYPVVSEDTETDKLTWAAYSTTELAQNGRKWKVNDGINEWTLHPDNDLVVRAWVPDPERGALPDAGAKAVLPVARELRGLTEHVSAQIDSRLAGAGILAVPQEVEVMRGQGNPDTALDDEAGGDEDLDPFVADLMEMMLTPIRDRASAAAVVPLVIKVPGEYVDKIRHIKLYEPLDPKGKELREEAIRRIALGMDSPPEVLLGLGSGSNHWSAWAISEEDVTMAIGPVGAVILHSLTVGWLQPMLREDGVPDWDQYVIWYDASALKLRPDRSSDARDLFDKGAVGEAVMRRENGFSDTDAPSDDEKKTNLLTQLLIGAPSLAPLLLPLLGIEVDASKLTQTSQIAEATGGDAPTGATPPPAKTPPDESGTRTLPDQPSPSSDTGPADPGTPS
nr:hypothetical protein OHB51_35605 [Micromonospora sp. NBC_00855]